MKYLLTCYLVILGVINLKGLHFINKHIIETSRILNNNLADSNSVISSLYSRTTRIPYKSQLSFSYSYCYNKASKIIQLKGVASISNNLLQYNIFLKDTKHIYFRNTFSVGDDYKYLSSYFKLNDVLIRLNKLRNFNHENELLPQLTNVWNRSKTEPRIKYYNLPSGAIYLIKGSNPFCNGHYCTDYVLYILFVKNGHAHIYSLYINGTNGVYDFNNTCLFFKNGSKNPMIYIPKDDRVVKSNADCNIYEVQFDGLRKR